MQKKAYGFVVDYYGITNHLTEALKVFDDNDLNIDDQMKSIKKLYELLQNYKRSALSIFDGVDKNNLDALMNILAPENKRAEFDVAYKRYAVVVEALMPNYVSKDDKDILKWLSYIRAAAKARFEPTQTLDISDCGEKVKELISGHLKAIIKWYLDKAKEKIPERVAYYEKFFVEKRGRIEIKDQKKRWASCTKEGNLTLNWKGIIAPANILDYIIVHEMCHLRYMNHSKEFWEMLGRVLPDYEGRKEWLMNNGIKMNV